jgi:hypothetical protein
MLLSQHALRAIVKDEVRRIDEAGISINRARELYGDDGDPAPRERPAGPRRGTRSRRPASKAQLFADQLHAFFQGVRWGQDFAEDQSTDVVGSLSEFSDLEQDELVRDLMDEKPVRGAIEQFLTYFVQAAFEAEGE